MATLDYKRAETESSKPGDAAHVGNGRQSFDPDEFRMTLGEHLEELRGRMILGLAGFAVAAVGCLIFGEHVVRAFCRPLSIALDRNGLPAQLIFTEVSEPFMVYIKISLISAACIASPWLLYQLWQFVASGLYSHERKYVTKYLPLSVVLLITGMLFLYFVVLPIMLQFFIAFQIGSPFSPRPHPQQDSSINIAGIPKLPVFTNGDPIGAPDGAMWLDAASNRLKISVGGQTRTIFFGSDNLVTPMITLAKYIDMVVGMLLAFGLAFQMPLVVLSLIRLNIIDLETMKASRRIVYFGMSIVAAVIVPDVITGMIALMVPLILLFELGLWMAREPKNKPAEPAL